MDIIALGGGQEVGRSCIIVSIANKTVMFDCGMHIGYNDARKFPDFSYITRGGDINSLIDCVLISHFHLDHCGALPYLTEVLGYRGPVYMTYPTRAVLPILLADCQRILQMKNKDGKIYSPEDVIKCVDRVIPINMNESVELDGIVITPYYAGHVIGAAMFHVRAGEESVVYTGDFSTKADKHLGSAWIARLKPDLMITESTYGSVIRDCGKSKERRFLQLVHDCVKREGKALIPIFALGRAQELCLLLESYWERMGLDIPIYFAGELTGKANEVYKRFISYTNHNINENMQGRNAFEFKYVKAYRKEAEKEGPCVIFSSPAMLHSGMSLKIFKNLCEDKNNLLILPGYCVRGTIGDKVLNGQKEISILGKKMNIEIQVESLAFSAHADTMGILKVLDQCQPKQVMLVHGDKTRMAILQKIIKKKMSIPVYMPANGTLLSLPVTGAVPVKVPVEILKKYIKLDCEQQEVNLVMKVQKVNNTIEATECEEFLIERKE